LRTLAIVHRCRQLPWAFFAVINFLFMITKRPGEDNRRREVCLSFFEVGCQQEMGSTIISPLWKRGAWLSSILSPFGKGGRGGILGTMEWLMIYKISPDPSLLKRATQYDRKLNDVPGDTDSTQGIARLAKRIPIAGHPVEPGHSLSQSEAVAGEPDIDLGAADGKERCIGDLPF